MKDIHRSSDRGPGVPEAVPRGLQRIGAELGAETLDRVWVFPPMISGRKESGLLAVSRLTAEDPDRRVLVILPYSAERTGKGLALEGSLEEQGEAPVESFPRMMEGVVRRAEKDLGEPRELEIGGDPSRFLACLDDFDPQLLDPELPPVWQPTEEPESEESTAEDVAEPDAAPVTGEGMVAAQEGAVGLLEDPLP